MIQLAARWALPAYCALAFLLGGSAQNVWGNLVLQLGALLLIGWAFLAERLPQRPRAASLLPWLLILLPILQLVPLPPWLWTMLPGRDVVVRGYLLQSEALPWLPQSLTPHDTIASTLLLLPPLAVFTAMTLLGAFRMRDLIAALLGGVLLHALTGLMQVAGGEGWYLYTTTNPGAAVGFFANANHLATLILASLPFLVAAAATRLSAVPARLLLGAAGLLLLLALVLTKSTAGLLLAVPVLGASLLLLHQWRLGAIQRVGIAASLFLILGTAALLVISNDFTAWSSRQHVWRTTAGLAASYAPFGSGLGSFEEVYRLAEDPAAVDRTFVNQAHNDYLQLALETGAPGLLLLGIFLLWWLRRTTTIWRQHAADLHARAATIASAALLAHSVVDYPLRSAANSVVLAICLALMCGARPRSPAPVRPLRHLTA